MQSFHIVTLGCKVNQYESQSLRESWLNQGLVEVEDPASAHVLVVNSCAITAKAVADVRATIRKLNRENPAAAIVVTGCAAEVMSDELSQIEGVEKIIRRMEKGTLLEREFLLKPFAQPALGEEDEGDLSIGAKDFSARTFSDDPQVNEQAMKVGVVRSFPPFTVKDYNRSRAVLKIQDGCSHCCTYCIVPRARGGAVSRPLNEALDEAGRLLEAGFAEIVISGINLRQFYGGEHGKQDGAFWEFVTALDERFASQWAGQARFRISSLEPGQLTPLGVEVLGRSQLIAPHIHLSLQSGSNSVLTRMGRGHYVVEDVTRGLENLAQVWPTFALGADIICGFPGETEAEHEETVDLLRKIPLTYAHIFPYSKRPHTVAAKMPDQIDGPVKKQRAAALRTLARSKQQQFIESMLNMKAMNVVVEEALSKDGKVQGVNEWYVECAFTEEADHVFAARKHKREAGFMVKAAPSRVEKGRLLVTLMA